MTERQTSPGPRPAFTRPSTFRRRAPIEEYSHGRHKHYRRGEHRRRGRVHATACQLYDAECAVHVALQTHVDPWSTAASGWLHQAVAELQATDMPVHVRLHTKPRTSSDSMKE
jgi:hypothetical protein